MNNATKPKPKPNNNSKPSCSTGSARHSSPTAQACAACKYQRRRCTPDCALAPYFPAEAQRQFLNAHRLFGVSNIHRLLRGLPDPRQRADAMRSVIYQSDARAADPAGGCYRIVLELERRCAAAAAELSLVLRHLALCRAQCSALLQQQEQDHHHHHSNHHNVASLDQFVPVELEAQYLEYFGDDDDGWNYNNNNNNNNNNDVSISSSTDSVGNHIVRDGIGNGVELQEVLQSTMSNLAEGVGGGAHAKPFVEMIDMGNTLLEPEPYEVEQEESSTIAHGTFLCSAVLASNDEPNSIENVQEHDLIEAASFFTFTSNNSSYV